MVQLFPALISQNTFVEVFHTILDLPLVVPALINSRNMSDGGLSSQLDPVRSFGTPHPPTFGPGEGFASANENSPFRVLYNYLLRNESGVSLNWWNQEGTRMMLNSFCDVRTPFLLC